MPYLFYKSPYKVTAAFYTKLFLLLICAYYIKIITKNLSQKSKTYMTYMVKKIFFTFYKMEIALFAIIPSIFKAPPTTLWTFKN